MKFFDLRKSLFAIAVCIVSKSKAEDWHNVKFTITQENKCLVSNKLNIIRTFARISVQECVSECGNRHDCQAVNYRRRVQICELLNSENGNLVKRNGKTGPCVSVAKSDIKELQSCNCSTGEVCNGGFCTTKECKSTTLENTEAVGNINTVGSQIIYNCSTGYVNTGQKNATCLPFGTWSNEPKCVADCGTPAIVTGASRSFTSTTENSVVIYTCLTYYTQTAGNLQLVCDSDGQWGGVLPTCTIDCGTPAAVSGATPSYASTTENSIVTYSCQTGYTQTGGNLQLVCGSHGHWGGVLPTCVPDCGTPATVSGATPSYTSTTENSIVIYSCQIGYTQTGGDLQLVCGSSGHWVGVFPICVPGCPTPPNVPYSTVNSGSMTVGAEWTYTCSSGTYFADGTNVITTTCQSGGQWSKMDIICPRDSAEQECPGCGLLRDCGDIQSLGLKQTGSYLIYPSGNVGINVRCDMDTCNGGWTIIQRRTSYSDFRKTWTEYKNGFGAVDGNYWLGNDNIATLTGLGNYKIRFDLYDQSNVHTYAVYSTFSITDESQKYRLTVSGYSGDAGDDFSSHSGMMFTTEDEDNDIAENTNCAKYYNGGWWFSNCHNANLNGEYGSTESGHGIMWYSVTGLTQSLSVTEIKMKRI